MLPAAPCVPDTSPSTGSPCLCLRCRCCSWLMLSYGQHCASCLAPTAPESHGSGSAGRAAPCLAPSTCRGSTPARHAYPAYSTPWGARASAHFPGHRAATPAVCLMRLSPGATPQFPLVSPPPPVHAYWWPAAERRAEAQATFCRLAAGMHHCDRSSVQALRTVWHDMQCLDMGVRARLQATWHVPYARAV